jgi:hypothetical protein
MNILWRYREVDRSTILAVHCSIRGVNLQLCEHCYHTWMKQILITEFDTPQILNGSWKENNLNIYRIPEERVRPEGGNSDPIWVSIWSRLTTSRGHKGTLRWYQMTGSRKWEELLEEERGKAIRERKIAGSRHFKGGFSLIFNSLSLHGETFSKILQAKNTFSTFCVHIQQFSQLSRLVSVSVSSVVHMFQLIRRFLSTRSDCFQSRSSV